MMAGNVALPALGEVVKRESAQRGNSYGEHRRENARSVSRLSTNEASPKGKAGIDELVSEILDRTLRVHGPKHRRARPGRPEQERQPYRGDGAQIPRVAHKREPAASSAESKQHEPQRDRMREERRGEKESRAPGCDVDRIRPSPVQLGCASARSSAYARQMRSTVWS